MADVIFESHLESIIKATERQLEKAAEEISQNVESHAIMHVSVGVYQSPAGKYIRTGNLRNSITSQVQEENGNYVIVIGASAEYAPYVELGTGKYAKENGRKTPWRYQDDKGNWHTTSGMPPRPFIRPAIENHLKEYRMILEDVLKDT